MKNNQAKCVQIKDNSLANHAFSLDICKKDEIKSLFCYGDEKIKKMIWKLKTDSKFCESGEGQDLMKLVSQKIACKKNSMQIIICPPSSSYWQSKKGFDHMHVFAKRLSKIYGQKYIPHAIIPKLTKNSQKVLNKKERQEQSSGAYRLSNYFRYYLKGKLKTNTEARGILEILIIDDVKTTGSTLNECLRLVKENTFDVEITIRRLTIAYEA